MTTVQKPKYEIGKLINSHSEQLNQIVFNKWKLRTLFAISKCRTAALGGHIDLCNNVHCNKLHLSYNSCRNRHCPKCQGHLKERWVKNRTEELLNCRYYHVVFTLPDSLNQLAIKQPAVMYNLLFKVAWSVLKDFGANQKFLGAQCGMISVLHTWGQNMSLHPHLHCIVPSGGLSKKRKWKSTKSKGKFLFPVKSMSRVYRARFVAALRKHKSLNADKSLLKNLFDNNWVIYAKRPFFGPKQVIEYLGRYSHKIAVSNHRIKEIKDGKIYFSAKDYRRGGKRVIISLSEKEFIRRFALHILPKGFTRIRHYGILSSSTKRETNKTSTIKLARLKL